MNAKYTEKDVVETLEHILAYHMFDSSPRAQDFLKYVVHESLEGRSGKINGTTIGQDVFEKGEDFDPIQDSVVRVYARRLRFMLRDYFLEHPARDPIIITIPKGGYKPLFVKNLTYKPDPPTFSSPAIGSSRLPNLKLIIASVIGVIIISAAFLLGSKQFAPDAPKVAQGQVDHHTLSYPIIAVAPFKNKTGIEDYDFLEESLQQKMVEDLSRFSLIRPLVYDSSYETLLTGKDKIYQYAFSGVILSVGPEMDLYIKLVDIENASLIFERRIRRSNNTSDYFDSLSEIVSELSGNFAGLEGAIVERRLETIEKQIDDDTLRILNLEAFECVGLVGKLVEDPSPALYKRIYRCLDRLLKENPENSTLTSAFGWITYVGAVSYEPVLRARDVNPDINAEDGIALMERAVKIDPSDAWAQQTLSAFKAGAGDTQGALKHGEMAVIANPGDPDNLTSLSKHLANVGQWDRALVLAQEALDRNPKPSSHYYHTFFLSALYNDDNSALQREADNIAALEDYYAFFYSYLAAIANEDDVRIEELQPDIDAIAARSDDGIMSLVNRSMWSDELRIKARALLIKNGTISPETTGAND